MRQRNKYDLWSETAMAMRFVVACACLLIMRTPAVASRANWPAMHEAEARGLAPGDYLWDPSLAPDGPLTMVVNLGSQRAYVYRDGKLIGISTISSGRPGYETPTGTFTVLEKQRMHHSNKYDDAPMPYMQRLSWSGLALHGGHPHGHPASHGCIRLPMGFAAALFKEQTRGMQVAITGHAPGNEDIMMASRQKARVGSQSGNLQEAKFSNGRGDANAPSEAPCCEAVSGAAPVIPSALQSAGSGDADVQTNSAADNNNGSHKAGRLQDGEGNGGQEQTYNNPGRSEGISDQSAAPPRS
jgi:hypothetical protein